MFKNIVQYTLYATFTPRTKKKKKSINTKKGNSKKGGSKKGRSKKGRYKKNK